MTVEPMPVEVIPVAVVQAPAAPVVIPMSTRGIEPLVVLSTAVPRQPPLVVRMASGVINLVVDGTLLAVGTALGAQIGLRVNAYRSPSPLPHNLAALLDNPVRLAYRKPDDLVGVAGVMAGMTVLEVGCGTGLFTAEMARAVGPDGRIHAVDMQLPMLERTRTRLDEAALGDRCTLHQAGAYALPLESQSVDIALLAATLGEVPDKLHALLELFRVVKPGGRLVISEELPHPAYLMAGNVRRLAEDAGFVFSTRTGSPFCYAVIFARP